MTRIRKHHNNKGTQTIKNGTTAKALRRAAARLGVQFKSGPKPKRKP